MKSLIICLVGFISLCGLFIGCCTTAKTTEFKNPVSLAPGNVNLKVVVMETKKQNDLTTCKVKIDEINGYGHSTPPLAPGAIIDVLFQGSDERISGIKVQDNLNIRVQYQPSPGEKGYWIFVSFN